MNDPVAKMGSINQTKNKSLIREKWKMTSDYNSDEDLEELQKKFFSSKLQPAASISKNIADSNTSHSSRNQLNVNNSKYNTSFESSEKFPQEESVDSLLESSMPAAQLIIDQTPPEVISSRGSLKNNLERDVYPLSSSISSIVKQKTKYTKTILPSASEPVITNNEKIIPEPEIPLESKSILFPGFSSNKVEETPAKNISIAQNLNSKSLKNNLSSKPIQKMSLFAKRRLLERTDPTFKAASKAGENIKISKDIKNFLTSKIPENNVSGHINNDFIINPKGFPENFDNDYISKGSEIPDISCNHHNDPDLSRIEKSSKKTVTFDVSPSYHDSLQNLNLDNNIDKISQMSNHEIVDAKEEIESLLSPKNIDFLLKRKNKNSKEKNSISDIPAIENLDEPLLKTINEALKKLNKKELKVDLANNQMELNALKNKAEIDNSPKIDKDKLKISNDVDNNIEIETLISRNEIRTKLKPHSESISESSKLNSNDFKSYNAYKKDSIPQISDNDTDFYKKLKNIYFESELDETDKLEWITSLSQAKSPSEKVLENLKEQSDRVAKITRDLIDGKETSLIDDPTAHLRFDFNGTLVDVLDDIPTYEGLHHHGENPDSAGYTIPELLHLSRSTVSGQRAIANKLIGNILHNINVLAFSETDSHAIYMCWLDWEGYLYFVTGWTDTYLTVQIEAIKSAWTWIVGMDQSKKLISRSNNTNSSFSAKSEAITKTFQALDRFLDILLENSQSIISELYTDRIPIGCKRMIFEIINTLNRYSDDFSIKLKSQKSLLSTVKDLNEK
ncbi:RNA polymerase II-associated protein rba50 [Smittium culicis]|uniref:RNA polymerase II-associated protein rba50 n=1 Tax=Smittium culicis TaxID=133412 RepID=A0A1R1X8T6_9FUNG|nr:RNA polymerase II-associated protein rba50 [Smittium culicis]